MKKDRNESLVGWLVDFFHNLSTFLDYSSQILFIITY